MHDVKPLVKIESLSKTYRGGVGPDGIAIEVPALRDVSLEIYPGEFVAVVGVNGSGKSTLVHCLASFEQPDRNADGNGSPVQCLSGGAYQDIYADVNWYRQNFVGVVFQAFHLLPKLRVWQNVEIPLHLDRCRRFTIDSAQRRQEVKQTLRQLDVDELFQRKINQLSGGQKQRVAIARALVKRPQLLLADEPTGNLDEKNKKILVETLAELAKQGVAVLMVTHDHRYVEEHANRIITLEDGKIKSVETLRPIGAIAAEAAMETRSAAVAKGAIADETAASDRPTAAAPAVVEEAAAEEAAAEEAAVAVAEMPVAIESAPEDANGPVPDDGEPVAHEPPEAADDRVYGAADDGPPPDASSPPPEPPPVATASAAHDEPPAADVVEPEPPAADVVESGREDADESATPQGLASVSKMLNPFKALRLPGCSQRFSDLASFAVRDAREGTISLVANVVAILMGTVLTALLISLLVGTDRFIEEMMLRIPGIDAVHVWVDYTTGETPMTEEEFQDLVETPGVETAVPNIQQFATVFLRPTRETVVTLTSAQTDDPETRRLKLLKGAVDLDPDGWEMLLNERVASEIDNFSPMSLVGKEITLQLRRYERSDDLQGASPSKVLDFPVRVVGIVENSPKDRVYGSVNMLRFVRDFSTGRSPYAPAPGGHVDLSKISGRTMYEGVRLHFADPKAAEDAYRGMKGNLNSRFDLFWPGTEMNYLRDVQVVAFLVLAGIGVITILAGSISVFNTLRASVARKTPEIGILRSLGLTRGDIFVTYISQAIIVGVLAAAVGLAAAWPLAKAINGWIGAKWEELAGAMELTGGLLVLPLNVGAVIFIVVLSICVLAALFPSMMAARKTPMDALRRLDE